MHRSHVSVLHKHGQLPEFSSSPVDVVFIVIEAI